MGQVGGRRCDRTYSKPDVGHTDVRFNTGVARNIPGLARSTKGNRCEAGETFGGRGGKTRGIPGNAFDFG